MATESTKQGRLAGKVAVITGGNSGIGLATALLFQKEGAEVAFIGRDPKTVASTVEALGGKALGFVGDVSKQKDLDAFYAKIKGRFDRIDVLFANAGIGGGTSIAETTEEEIDTIFGVNFKGAFFSVQKALPLLRKGSSVIVTSSVADQIGMPGMVVYAASKAAIRSFVRGFAAEYVGQGIRINTVSPGPIETPIFARSGASKQEIDEFKKQFTDVIPMKRIGTSEEVAKAALFLASDDSSFTTGAEIMVDGGLTQI
jgi:NAD(P)-dependent dehydrogenase (short-subunit alcohol dehydrogenase family)